MRQTLLFPLTEADTDGRPLLVDLFCGAGGFTEGAKQAGYRPHLAWDCDEGALETHRRNHREARHESGRLPDERVRDLFPPRDVDWHLHGSPPCNKFSTQNAANRVDGDRCESEKLLDWFLDLALTSGAKTWSMENVASARVLEAVKSRAGQGVDWEVFDMSLFGVPQTRKRLIAGSPCLIEKLRRMAETPTLRSVADVVPEPKGTHIRTGKCWKRSSTDEHSVYSYQKATLGDHCHPVTGLAPTVTTSSTCWATPEGRRATRFRFSVADIAALQTFPKSYMFPNAKNVATTQIANAVPCLFARRMLE